MRSKCDGLSCLAWGAAGILGVLLLVLLSSSSWVFAQNDIPGMKTRWAAEVDPAAPLPEYPRPQLVRETWLNLNGWWDYAIRPRVADGTNLQAPTEWDGQIVVPFCPESALSRVHKRVGEKNYLFYQKTVTIPADWPADQRVLLHFGAVDWETTVVVNGKQVGEHRGGYDPFTFDITEALHADRQQANTLLVRVWDPTDTGSQPRGKQVNRPHGIWYTPVTGIWQTVWLEPVPRSYIRKVTVVPDLDAGQFQLSLDFGGDPTGVQGWKASSSFERRAAGSVQSGTIQAARTGLTEPLQLKLPPNSNWAWWTPDSPTLFDIVVELTDRQGNVVDRVQTYSAFRKIHFQKDERGHNRMYLNNSPLFQYGPLDQGWWPDGLYTAPTDAALRYDIELTKELGFNMARKHVKVEPARWYYWCDKLGLLVWQDMPSGMRADARQFVQPDWEQDGEFSEQEAAQYRAELQAMIDALRHFPCIVVWVPFNEGWGQHRTNETLAWVKQYDPTRLVGGPSGWTDRGEGDLKDMHKYPGPGMFPVMDDRVSVLGEFGGLGLPLEGHTLLSKDNWGYRTYTTREELQTNYERLVRQLPGLIADGLAAAVYTQTTDVEVEVNGLVTYDREVLKFDAAKLQQLHARLYGPLLQRKVLVPTSEQQPQTWSYTFSKPDPDWPQPAASTASWKTGPGGFGTEGTPNTIVRTVWNTPDIWMRRSFELTEIPVKGDLAVRLYHDEDATVYLNGHKVAEVQGYNTQYIEVLLPESARRLLQPGQNWLGVHCDQTGGGQFIDVGLNVLAP
jgi:hypothetical protein